MFRHLWNKFLMFRLNRTVAQAKKDDLLPHDYWRGYFHGFAEKMNPFRWFIQRVIKHVPPGPFVPDLTGFRPLKNGRLALVYYNEGTLQNEVRVADLWSYYADSREHCIFKHLFDPDFFSSVMYYEWGVWWPCGLDMDSQFLYRISELVGSSKADFFNLV